MEKVAGAVEILVRIKPYNPKRNHFKQRHHTFFGFNFSEAKGWCKVPSKIKVGGKVFDVEDYLRGVLNNEDDPDSEPVFDVCTIKEAQAIDAKEKAEKEQRRTADKADLIGGINRPVEMGSRVESSEVVEASEERKPRAARGRHAVRP